VLDRGPDRLVDDPGSEKQVTGSDDQEDRGDGIESCDQWSLCLALQFTFIATGHGAWL